MADAMTFGIDRAGMVRLRQQLEVLALSPDAKRKLVREMAMEVRRFSRQNIKQQRCVDGTPMAPRKIYKRNRRGKLERRKDGKENRKMLVGLGRAMSIAANRRGQGEVSWKDFGMGAIADKHQHGKSETVAAKSEAKRLNKDSDYYNPKARVERWLAKELIARGYRKEVRLKNGRVRQQKVAVSWIVQNMSRAEAMAIWQQLTGYDAPDSWTVGVPERAFLGVNLRQSGTMLEELARLSLNRLRSKGKV
ncbi:phage virion morphogenesis protein [Desulfovibrio subterraneus]|uniref:Phage protein n=1 Tax=Desulfovibrio subterraneus TaxID=2718620 RepID=A0A7J0BLU4_9BACT|nr:phage virion morphogenesis protein [Desulfovibrio subterraneus]GFM34211.1 hypothetical protein DSM101010T_25760 [Desulfovibrio subterraneus]